MASLSTWMRYIVHKFHYSAYVSWKSYKGGQITDRDLYSVLWKNMLQGKLTYLHWNKGHEMAPTVGEQGGTLLVRKIPDPTFLFPSHESWRICCGNYSDILTRDDGAVLRRSGPLEYVHVGDVVVLKDPQNSENHLVRRLVATEGYEMASTDENEESFVLEKDQCWVQADNDKLKAKEANDSRIFGPVSMTDIVGRAIYCLRTAVDHGPVQNSKFSMQKDSPVLQVELDVDEMANRHRA